MPIHKQPLDVDHETVYSGSPLLNAPPAIKRPRYCKLCNKKLSIYNLNKYCFVHAIKGQTLDDIKEENRLRKGWIHRNKNKVRKKRTVSKTLSEQSPDVPTDHT